MSAFHFSHLKLEVSLCDVPNYTATADLRCGVCDCLVPKGQVYGEIELPTGAVVRVCSSTCLGGVLDVDRIPLAKWFESLATEKELRADDLYRKGNKEGSADTMAEARAVKKKANQLRSCISLFPVATAFVGEAVPLVEALSDLSEDRY